jgi:GTP-binding protein
LYPIREKTLTLPSEHIEDDELMELTPSAIRLRKIYLRESGRKRIERQAKGAR